MKLKTPTSAEGPGELVRPPADTSGFFQPFLRFGQDKVFCRRRIPALIAVGVILLVCLMRLFRLDLAERMERMTYDMRVRLALRFHPAVAPEFAFVFIDEQSLRTVWDGSLGYRFGMLWPRQVYGRVVQELAEQGAKAVALDIIFAELRPDHTQVRMSDGNLVESDEFFALQMKRASNVIISMTRNVITPPLFLTNALAAGDISTDKDEDGILRRAQAFTMYRIWHPAFLQAQAQAELGINLLKARLEPGRIVLPRSGAGLDDIPVALDKDGNFDLSDFGGKGKAKPFTEKRVWHMGVVLAAMALGLDLDRAEIDLRHGRIVMHGPGGLQRALPVDEQGQFYIDWSLPVTDPQLATEPIQRLLWQNRMRLEGEQIANPNRFRSKLVVVGSSAILGNNLTDRGATPLDKDTLLPSKHWNVANSIILDRPVRHAPLAIDLALITLLGVLAARVTWQLRTLTATGYVLSLAVVYTIAAAFLYIQSRYWIPVILPLGGGLLMNYVCLLVWRVLFEQAEQRRIKTIFSRVVSRKIVDVLLSEDPKLLYGARREITVLFADVRGFTELTDTSQERVDDFVRQNGLTGEAADAARDEQARETLDTVNLYLGLVAEVVKKHDGTLDKFIGDCVMAFWGAPVSDPKHASGCVRAAISAQRAIFALNLERESENKRRELENRARASAGLRPKPMLPLLLLGSGINSGMATAGLMGLREDQENYTVFGREVNLASRLEGLSGRGRIFISQATYERLLQEDPELAATCISRPPEKVKGISAPVAIYEVPWRAQEEPAPDRPSLPAIAEPLRTT